MKKKKLKDSFLAELRRIPIIQVACEKVGLSRTSVYRWREEDKEFLEEMDKALSDGEALVNDMTESQLLSLIKEKNWSAVSFWLRHRNPKFRDRVEITTKVADEALSPEQEAVVREALKHGRSEDIKNDNQKDNELHTNDSARVNRDDDKGPEGENSDNKI